MWNFEKSRNWAYYFYLTPKVGLYKTHSCLEPISCSLTTFTLIKPLKVQQHKHLVHGGLKFGPLFPLSCDGIGIPKQVWSTYLLSEFYDPVINSPRVAKFGLYSNTSNMQGRSSGNTLSKCILSVKIWAPILLLSFDGFEIKSISNNYLVVAHFISGGKVIYFTQQLIIRCKSFIQLIFIETLSYKL